MFCNTGREAVAGRAVVGVGAGFERAMFVAAACKAVVGEGVESEVNTREVELGACRCEAGRGAGVSGAGSGGAVRMTRVEAVACEAGSERLAREAEIDTLVREAECEAVARERAGCVAVPREAVT